MFWRRSGSEKTPCCSFCRKGENVVGELIASPANDDPLRPPCYICSECIAVCDGILRDRRRSQEDYGKAVGTGDLE